MSIAEPIVAVAAVRPADPGGNGTEAIVALTAPPRSAGANASHRFLVADALRGIAALMVVFYHVEQARHAVGWFSRGYLAVDFFFMLSGFVMAHSYDRRWSARFGPTAFLRARVVRLWPTMALGIVAGAVVALASGARFGPTAGLCVLALAFVPVAGARDGVFPLNGVQWSLLNELVANIAHAALLHRLSDRRLAILTALFAATLFAIARVTGNLSVGDAGSAWVGGFFRVGFAYPAGMLLHRLWRRRVQQAQVAPAALALVALPVVIFCCSAISGWTIDPLVVVVVVPMIIWIAVSARLPVRVAALAGAVGQLSYPLYALHRPVIALIVMLVARF